MGLSKDGRTSGCRAGRNVSALMGSVVSYASVPLAVGLSNVVMLSRWRIDVELRGAVKID